MKKEINLDVNKIAKKTGIVLSIIIGVILAIILVNAFYKDNYLQFRSPIILQSPAVIKTREPEVIEVKEEVKKEETEEEVVEYVPSRNTLALIDANPGLAGKIKRAFGSEWRYAAELIAREASFDPFAVNPVSGACGLAQALPCEKMACELSDIDCQLEWIGEYVSARYGSFERTIEFHDVNNYY